MQAQEMWESSQHLALQRMKKNRGSWVLPSWRVWNKELKEEYERRYKESFDTVQDEAQVDYRLLIG